MEMEYCFDHAVPHSQFMEWSEDDQDKVIAYNVFKRTVCAKCGTIPEDWLDEQGEYLEPPPYVVTTRHCPGCATLSDAREEIPQERRESFTTYFTKASTGSKAPWQMKRSQ
jgi:hypothetical protein